jgi:hypothetical protein
MITCRDGREAVGGLAAAHGPASARGGAAAGRRAARAPRTPQRPPPARAMLQGHLQPANAGAAGA